MSTTVSFKWNLQEQNILSTLKWVSDKDSCTDVILVSDDLIPHYAHKFVLSACSSVMKEVFLSIDQSITNPLVYLKGVKSEVLQKLLELLYFGEVHCDKQLIESFSKAAESIRLYGINFPLKIYDHSPINEHVMEKLVSPAYKDDFVIDASDDEMIKEEPSDNNDHNKQQFETSKADKIHLCTECDKSFTQRSTLRKHIKYKHKGFRFPCNECEYKATQKICLKNHKLRKHGRLLNGDKNELYQCKRQPRQLFI